MNREWIGSEILQTEDGTNDRVTGLLWGLHSVGRDVLGSRQRIVILFCALSVERQYLSPLRCPLSF